MINLHSTEITKFSQHCRIMHISLQVVNRIVRNWLEKTCCWGGSRLAHQSWLLSITKVIQSDNLHFVGRWRDWPPQKKRKKKNRKWNKKKMFFWEWRNVRCCYCNVLFYLKHIQAFWSQKNPLYNKPEQLLLLREIDAPLIENQGSLGTCF